MYQELPQNVKQAVDAAGPQRWYYQEGTDPKQGINTTSFSYDQLKQVEKEMDEKYGPLGWDIAHLNP